MCYMWDRGRKIYSSIKLYSKNILADAYEALPEVLGNRGNRAFISGEQGNKGQILRGTKTILGNRGTSQFISGEQGNRYPPLGGHCLSYSIHQTFL